MRDVRLALGLAFAALAGGACGGSKAPLRPAVTAVAAVGSARRPTFDTDGRGPESDHGDALGRLLDAPWGSRLDRRRLVALPLPDAEAWTHVKYWGITTLAGFRYGDDHHAALAVFTFPPPGAEATVDDCAARFASWGASRAKAFDILVGTPRVESIEWSHAGKPRPAKVFVLDAERRTLFGNKRYAAAYAVYPAWKESCLVIGGAVPELDVPEAARAVRDRLVRDALPNVTVKAGAGMLALEGKSDVD